MLVEVEVCPVGFVAYPSATSIAPVTRKGGAVGPAGPGAVAAPVGVQSAGTADCTVGQAVPGGDTGVWSGEKPPGVVVSPVTV